MKRMNKTGSGFCIQRKHAPEARGTFCTQGGSALILLLGLTCLADILLDISGLAAFPVLPIAGAAVCLLYMGLSLLHRTRWLDLILPGIVLAAALMLYADVSGGVRLICNHAFEVLTARTGRLYLAFPAAENPRSVPLALGIVGALTGLLSWHMAGRWPKAAALCILVGLAAEILLLAPVAGNICVWLAAASAILLLCGSASDGVGSWKMTLLRMGCVLLCTALCFGIVRAVLEESLFHDLREETEQRIHEARYETDGAILPEGDLAREVEESRSESAVLEVTMETPETLYLRGFVGDTFDGTRWEALSGEVLEAHSGLLYWLHASGFYPQAQLSAASGLLPEETEVNRITVRNLAACSQYLYTPYNLSGLTGGGSLSLYELETGALKAGVLQGVRAYSFTTVDGGSERLEALLDFLQENEDPQTLEYRSAEGSYRELVDQYDLEVSEELLVQLQPTLDACCAQFGSREELTMAQAQVSTWLFLQEYENMQEDATAFERATMTAMALRYFGIPARYAEGYVVTEKMAAAAEPGEAIAVTADCGTAWVEIYQDGMGWLPLELTPGYQALSGSVTDQTEQSPGSSGSEHVRLPEGEELDEPETEEDNVEETPQDQSQTRLPWAETVLPWGLLLLLLLLAGIWLRHSLILRKRTARFESADCSAAVGYLFADSAVLLRELGIDRGTGSMEDLGEAVEEQFGPDYAKQYDSMVRLNGEALFSSHLLEEEHREQAKAFRRETCELLKSQRNWFRRLWIRWIRCLW